MKLVRDIFSFSFLPIVILLANVGFVSGMTDILIVKDDDSNSPDMIYEDVLNAGYHADIVVSSLVNQNDFSTHRLVILSTGSNPDACSNNFMRSLLVTYVLNGGRLIIEGGHNGYTASVYPAYPGFRNKVLKINRWVSNSIGSAIMKSEFQNSPLANLPAILPVTMPLVEGTIYDQDVCESLEFSQVFYGALTDPSSGAVIVAPTVADPQIINFCFSYSSIQNHNDAKDLILNSIFNLIGSPVSVSSEFEAINDFRLHQNYPNPFNPLTTITFEVGRKVFVSMIVYDVRGRKVLNLLSENKLPGGYEIRFDGSELPGGVYFYKLEIDGNFFQSRRMLLVK